MCVHSSPYKYDNVKRDKQGGILIFGDFDPSVPVGRIVCEIQHQLRGKSSAVLLRRVVCPQHTHTHTSETSFFSLIMGLQRQTTL